VVPDNDGDQSSNGAYVVLGDAVDPRLIRRGWCAVVRPDRTVLHDGPIADAERIVSQTIRLVTTGAAT
jgi:3-(3-hydroxy-phenyl)propionate hydroxylase